MFYGSKSYKIVSMNVPRKEHIDESIKHDFRQLDPKGVSEHNGFDGITVFFLKTKFQMFI